ncbi:MAG: glutamyl-tRNA reductase [Planctomycetota bacterium]|jgi:glutamyl-tRNA reductase
MQVVVVGLNHKTAPVDIREKLAFDTTDTATALEQLKGRFHEAEFVLLSTCNRVELYCASSPLSDTGVVDADTVAAFFSEFHNVPSQDFKDFLYVRTDGDAVRHLLTVASSLDSMVVGEDQIIGQVKESYRLACSARSTGKVLNRLFHCAFATSKKIHTNTSISTGRVSIAGIAVELALQLFADIKTAKVVVIGAGEMGELLVQHLLHAMCKSITVVNRSHERGLSVAKRYGIMARRWNELDESLRDANIVIASAATQDYLFNKDSFKKMMDQRREQTLLIIDIAVPRNFEPSVNEIDNVYLYSVDELSEVAEQNRKARKADIAKGTHIIGESVAEFMDWFRARDIGPLLGQMKERFAQISQNELERFFVGVRQDASCRAVMESMVRRIVNRLLHCVIKNVDVVAKEHGPDEAAKLVDSIVRRAEEISSETTDKDNGQS